jgi:putative component of toxin-antitoxin plasmid stabilization module
MLQAAKMAEAFSRWASSKRDMIDNIRLKGNYSKAEERALVNELEVEEREIYREYLDELKGLKAQRAERVEASR